MSHLPRTHDIGEAFPVFDPWRTEKKGRFSRENKLGKKNKKFVAHLRDTGKAVSDFGSIRALRLGGVADKRNPIVPGANWFGILVYVD